VSALRPTELKYRCSSYVATGEVTTLEHELRDDTVELGAGVAEALLASAESAEVLSGLGDNVVVESEVDAAGAGCEGVVSALIVDDGWLLNVAWMTQMDDGEWRGNLRAEFSSLEMTLPLMSQLNLGPVHWQSK